MNYAFIRPNNNVRISHKSLSLIFIRPTKRFFVNTYALPRNSKAWQNALEGVQRLLPQNAAHNIDDLENLPIFAVVIVIHTSAMTALMADGQDMESVVQTWVSDQRGWLAVAVADDEQAIAHAHKISTHESLSGVHVYRYLLIPTDDKQMTPSRKEAIAHIIDEQLTSYLRQTLKPKLDHGITLDGDVTELTAEQLEKVSKHQHLDVHILSIAQMLRPHKLVCFDMDSTLIEQEVIVELAAMAGIEHKVAEITEAAMRGEMEFSESFARRVALLEGLDVSVMDDIIKERITFSAGAFATIKALNANGCRTVLVSGGFLPFAKYVAQTLGMDEYYANPLMEMGGKLTGSTDTNIIDGKAKARIVTHLAHEMGVGMDQVVCVGDGANDLPMMHLSDIGVAYRAKPIVRAKADTSVNVTGLEGVLYAMGHRFDRTDE